MWIGLTIHILLRVHHGETTEYLADLTTDRRESVEKLMDLVLKHVPSCKNGYYRMPTYSLSGLALFAIASQKNFLAFYVMPHDLVNDQFGEKLAAYNCGKSCIRFKTVDRELSNLIREIVVYIVENFHLSQVLKM